MSFMVRATAVGVALALLGGCASDAVGTVSTQSAEAGEQQDAVVGTFSDLVLQVDELPDGDVEQTLSWLARLPNTLAGSGRVLPAGESSAVYATDGNIEFGIEATDSGDPYGDIAIDEVFDLLASDMAVKALCAGNAGRRCVAGTSPDGMSVMVWSAAGDELLLAAVAPDVQGLSLFLEEWRTVGGA